MNRKSIYLFFIAVVLALWAWDMVYWERQHDPQPKAETFSLYDHIQQKKELTVGVVKNPVSYFISRQGASGLEYDLSQQFAHYLGVKLEMKVFPTHNQLFTALHNHDIDIAASNLLFDSQKAEHYQIGPGYYSAGWQLVYRKGNRVPQNLGDLRGVVAVAKGSGLNDLLLAFAVAYPNLRWEVRDDSQEELLMKVAESEYYYTIANSMLIASTQKIRPNLDVAFDVAPDTTVHWYLAPTDDYKLQDALLSFMDQSIKDGNLARLEEKYIDYLKTFDYVDTRAYIAAIREKLPLYEQWFKDYCGDLDWQLLAAISYQESHWDPRARSVTGVRGMMMLTQPTARAMGVTSRINPQQSIEGGAKYLRSLIARLPDGIPKDDRIWYALLAYNMGMGHLYDLRALTEKLGGDPNNWQTIKNNLPLLSVPKYYRQLKYGYARGFEAFQYVENIRRYLSILKHYHRVEARYSEPEQSNTETY